jgi:capsule polysaccharide export protein KpsC/LpsZ
MLKRFRRGLEDQHPASLSDRTWEMLKKIPWTKEHVERIIQELFKNYSTGGWFSEVGTQFHTSMMEKEKVQKMLGLDPKKKTAVIFPHLFWDATFFWGEDIFTNYRDWYIHAVKAACENPNLNWVIKIHPANVVKLNRDGYKGELVEKLTIREAIGELPPHVKLLEPNTQISTYSLYAWIDYCLTVRGTPGIEAAMFGVPVFTAGTGRYDRHGFTIDSVNRQDYLEKLSRIHTYPRLTPEQIELAQKFAYGTFLLRPFSFKSMKIAYARDKKATARVDYLIDSSEQLLHAPDVNAFGQWLTGSQDEDYIDPSKL